MASARWFALGVQGEETFGGQAPLRACASRLATPVFGGNRNSVHHPPCASALVAEEPESQTPRRSEDSLRGADRQVIDDAADLRRFARKRERARMLRLVDDGSCQRDAIAVAADVDA